MRSMPRRECRQIYPPSNFQVHLLTTFSPLKPEELQVLRAQYEKEGDMVGVQTKFNFAWVSSDFRSSFDTPTMSCSDSVPRRVW